MNQGNHRESDVYEITETQGESGTHTTDSHSKKIQSSERTGSAGVKIRAAVVCLVLLCVLLLTVVTGLCVHILTKNTNCTQLLTDNMALNKLELQKLHLDGWKWHQSSLYFLSSEKKNWTESRKYCTDRGADLISINNREEQGFVKNMSIEYNIWIGLNDIEEEGRWKWVDGSSGTSGFWELGQPNSFNGNEEDCGSNHPTGWADYPCDRLFIWICEKSFFL